MILNSSNGFWNSVQSLYDSAPCTREDDLAIRLALPDRGTW